MLDFIFDFFFTEKETEGREPLTVVEKYREIEKSVPVETLKDNVVLRKNKVTPKVKRDNILTEYFDGVNCLLKRNERVFSNRMQLQEDSQLSSRSYR